LGGFLADWLGLGAIYRFSAGLFILSTALVWLLPERRERPDGEEALQKPVHLLSNSRYLGFLALTFVIMLGMYLPQPLSPNYLQSVHGLRYSDVGTLGMVGGLGNVALSLALGAWPNWRLAYLAAQAAVAGFALMLWRGNGLPVFALGYFLLGGYRAARSLTTAKIRALVHVNQVALAYAVSETVSGVAGILAPILAGALYESAPARMYSVSLNLLLFTLAGTVFFYRRKHAAHPSPDARTG
jgi:predicted MFS family arabinose efflux permease